MSPAPDTGLRIPPSGAINISPNQVDSEDIPNAFDTTVGPVGEVSNTLGCAGIGQSEYTSGVFNMPETFQKFQKDVNSTLSKDLLSLNFVMPQTSALFDQLNNFGNQRFDQFQRACNVSALQQDAKQSYMLACVEKLTPARKAVIEEDNNKRSEEAKIPAAQIGPMAYAQAWEICGNYAVSDTTALAVRNEKLKAFYEQTRKVERVDEAIRPYLCPATKDNDAKGAGCWKKFLLPQVRVCLGNTLEKGCTEGEYGIKEPVISMQRLFDTMRFVMEDEVVARRVVSLTTQFSNQSIDKSTLHLAASDASLMMSTGTITRNAESRTGQVSGTTGAVAQISILPDESVLDYQLNYLSCKNVDVLNPLKQYVRFINKRRESNVSSATSINDVSDMSRDIYEAVVDKMKLPTTEGSESDEADIYAVSGLLEVALGCTVNQSIPIFDPNITASLQTQCGPQDRSAFYAMAGYDVSLQATRDVYRYLGLKLKQTYARLLTEAMVPVSDTTSTAVSPTLSPELNSKFATVVKDVMIPYVESQIQRLDELSSTRGAFGQRVREIYKAKDGCISGDAGWFSRGGVRN